MNSQNGVDFPVILGSVAKGDDAQTPRARKLRIEIFRQLRSSLPVARARRDMDPYQMFVELYVRSAGDGDHAASGSGGLSDGHAGGHTDGDHHSHAHPGTVLFLFVAIAVGGNVNKKFNITNEIY